MKEFKTRDIITPIMEFIKTCPFLDDYNIDLSDFGVQKIIDEKPDGSAIDYIGSTQLSSSIDLINKAYTERQASFDIWLLRRSDHDFYRKEITEFIWNFEQWIEYCQAYGLTPKISENESDQYVETMSASNGAFVSEWEGQESSIYVIQLNINYYNRY